MKNSALLTAFLIAAPMAACEDTRESIIDDNPLAPDEGKTSDLEEPAEDATEENMARVRADIIGKSGSDLKGMAVFTETGDGVTVTVEVSNADRGMHGLHIHQKADCSAPDAKSAGGHFAPRGHGHGLLEADKRHLGDLGNLEVDKDGNATKTVVVEDANLDEGDDHSFLGRAVMIHAKKDDGGQPTGNAGARIGCGEIPTKPEPAVQKPM